MKIYAHSLRDYTSAYTVASEKVLVFEARQREARCHYTVADHVLLAVNGRQPQAKPLRAMSMPTSTAGKSEK